MKKSFFTNLFFEDETQKNVGAEDIKVKKEQNRTDIPTPTYTAPSSSTSSNPSNIVGEIVPTLFDRLSKEVEKANLPGVDYFEFKQSMAGMSTLNLPPATLVGAAFGALQHSGLTKKILIDSLNHYINLIEGEKSHFDQELAKMGDGRINGVQSVLNNTKTAIDNKRKQIEKLELEIADLEKVVVEREKELETLSYTMRKKEADFVVTSSAFLSQLHADLELIEKSLN